MLLIFSIHVAYAGESSTIFEFDGSENVDKREEMQSAINKYRKDLRKALLELSTGVIEIEVVGKPYFTDDLKLILILKKNILKEKYSESTSKLVDLLNEMHFPGVELPKLITTYNPSENNNSGWKVDHNNIYEYYKNQYDKAGLNWIYEFGDLTELQLAKNFYSSKISKFDSRFESFWHSYFFPNELTEEFLDALFFPKVSIKVLGKNNKILYETFDTTISPFGILPLKGDGQQCRISFIPMLMEPRYIKNGFVPGLPTINSSIEISLDLETISKIEGVNISIEKYKHP